MKKTLDNKLIQFGKNVRTLRQKQTITQEDLAAKVGCDVRTIQNIEAGGSNVTLKKVYSLAEALKVKPSELI